MSLISMQIFELLLLILILATNGEITSKPNIIYILFDDLGYNDVGYNGGSYKTPVLDGLAANNAIKLNLHYAESTCSPSRTALYTGRYPFKAGLNTVNAPNSDRHFNNSLTLFPQILAAQGYQNLIVGKWHIGYKYASLLPPNRGFSAGLYQHASTGYIKRASDRFFTNFDTEYPTSDNQVITRRTDLFPENKLVVADIYRIINGAEQIAYDLVTDTTYTEKLYTDYVVDFINSQTADTSFYTQINFFTPHATLTEPPELDPNYQYQYATNCGGLSREKELFCKVMLYAQERIDEIKEKIQEKGFWDDTIFIVTSDNGPTPESGGYGQTLPLKGIKSGPGEGSLRTPAFMFGGWIQAKLAEIGANYCEYNKMVHMSDWYKIFTDILGISNDVTVSRHLDSDHSSLQIWDDILCSCDSNCNQNYQERTQLISMRVCGDENTYSTDMYPNKYYYSSFIFDKGLKLVINGSIAVTDSCPNTMSQIGAWKKRNSYDGIDPVSGAEKQFNTPNQNFFDTYYKPQVTGTNAARGKLLYGSTCLDALNGTNDINNANYGPFKYDEKMLYDIENDKIEACNIASTQSSDVTNLYNILQESGLEYTAPQNVLDSVGSLWQQVLSYDCDYNVVFLQSWEGLNDDKCGSDAKTRTDVNVRECQDIWRRLNNLKTNCPTSAMAEPGEKFLYDHYDATKYKNNLFFLFFVFAMAAASIHLCIFNIYQCVNIMKEKKKKNKYETVNIDDSL